jgi:hypothetical protein
MHGFHIENVSGRYVGNTDEYYLWDKMLTVEACIQDNLRYFGVGISNGDKGYENGRRGDLSWHGMYTCQVSC